MSGSNSNCKESLIEISERDLRQPGIKIEENNLLQNFIHEFIEEQLNDALIEVSSTYNNVENREHEVTINLKQGLFQKLILVNNNKYKVNMSQLLTIVLVIWSIIHTIYYALLMAKSITIREAPPPLPFFRNTAGVIQDFYDGSMDSPELLMVKAEFTVVMLYASWESRSKLFRRPFFEVAQLFHFLPSVKFVAANCHHYKGKCRKMYKLLSFPIIFAYTPYGQPVIFNQMLSSDRLFTWIQHLLSPLEVVKSSVDHRNFISGSDFGIVGYFALQRPNPLPFSYHVFLNTAYKFSNVQPILHFGVVLNSSLAMELQFSSIDQLHFYTFYESDYAAAGIPAASFQMGGGTKTQDLINWINECIHKHVRKSAYELELEDLENPGKSETLFQQINSSSATVVLFTNMLGLNERSPSLIELKNLVRLFHYCSYTEADQKDENPILKAFHIVSLQEYFRQTLKVCKWRADEIDACCEKFSSNGMCSKGESDPFGEKPSCIENTDLLFSKDLIRRRCCLVQRKLEKATGKLENALRNRYFWFDWKHLLACQFIHLLRKGHRKLLREYTSTKVKDNSNRNSSDILNFRWLIGAGCRLNQTIGFLAMDKRFSRYFMQKWGLTEERIEMDSVAIVTRAEEKIYWMGEEKINLFSLMQFLDNFLNNTLVWQPINQHLNDDQQMHLTENYRQDLERYSTSTMKRLNLQLFMEEIVNKKNRKHDAIVFFSGGDWHGPSRTVLHYLHQTKHYFHEFNELIKFYIIDTGKNTLPWAFRFERLPAVAFFSTTSNGESFVFPNKLAFTVPNLLAFILPRCSDRLRWHLAFIACKEKCLTENYQKMEMTLRRLDASIHSLIAITRRRKQTHKHLSLGLYNLRLLLRRQQLQRAALIRMQTIVDDLQRHLNEEPELLEVRQRSVAKEAELMEWLLANRFGLHSKYA